MDVRGTWERLAIIRELWFEARPLSATASGWSGRGEGTVEVERIDPGTLIFHERGVWKPDVGREMPFRNVFRWTVAPEGDHLRLEHLRFGVESPVFLFDLVPVAVGVLESSGPHACGRDRYSARMVYDQEAIRVNWTITGPKKDESLAYRYR